MSPAKLEANRLNAQKSTGPRTAEGKRISSRNSRSHGLTGRTLLLEPDEQLDYLGLVKRYLAELKPVGILEEQIVQSVADSYWQLNNLQSMKNHLLSCLGISALTSSEGDKISRYESRIHRMLMKSLLELRTQQAARLAPIAIDAAQPASLKKESKSPPNRPDGFVLSNSPTFQMFESIEAETLEKVTLVEAA